MADQDLSMRQAAIVRRGGVQPQPDMRRMWLYPVIGITGFALAVFATVYSLDYFVFSAYLEPATDPLTHYIAFNPELVTDALPALGMTVVAVLGIVLTVIAIIVQLSSDRYTGVALMFMRDRINIAVLSYFVVVSIFTIWLSVTLQDAFVPRAALVTSMMAAGVGLALMLPYFAYVFWFLEPGNIIERIRSEATQLAMRGSASRPEVAALMQERVLNAMEEITDIANNSIDGKDKIITSHAVDALRDFVLDYLEYKPDHDHYWYRIVEGIRANPDFVAMDEETLNDLDMRWIWVEWKVLRQYLGVYNEALTSMQDINYLIAINTRYIGEAAAARGNDDLVDMVFRFMNSYLRSAINARSTRTAYNVLHQYRMLIASMLKLDRPDTAYRGVAFLKYYGHISFEENLTFITETVAYDLAALCQYAHETGAAKEEEKMLKQFLDLDRPTRGHRQERGLRGVRKAQAKLAAYYLSVGEDGKARMIAEDMVIEPADLLHSIRDELARVESKHFWENVDRGRNFEYMPPEHREQLEKFFSWLEAAPPPRRRATDR